MITSETGDMGTQFIAVSQQYRRKLDLVIGFGSGGSLAGMSPELIKSDATLREPVPEFS